MCYTRPQRRISSPSRILYTNLVVLIQACSLITATQTLGETSPPEVPNISHKGLMRSILEFNEAHNISVISDDTVSILVQNSGEDKTSQILCDIFKKYVQEEKLRFSALNEGQELQAANILNACIPLNNNDLPCEEGTKCSVQNNSTYHVKKIVYIDYEKPSRTQVWVYGLVCVGIICLSSLGGVAFVPLMNTPHFYKLMCVLLGLSAGTLSATATFQLIPEAFRLPHFDPNYLSKACFMLGSMWLLFLIEALFKILSKGKHDHRQDEKLLVGNGIPLLPIAEIVHTNGLDKTTDTTITIQENGKNVSSATTKHKHDHNIKAADGSVSSLAWMILLGDGLHNFIDGMSIGAGFTDSITTGISISIAIACEEFPHELGDFAILINSGIPVKKALLYNFLSASTIVWGLVLGIILGEIDGSVYIFAFAGGLFLYITLADLIPELNEMIDTKLQHSRRLALFTLFIQNIGIMFGVALLYCLTRWNGVIGQA